MNTVFNEIKEMDAVLSHAEENIGMEDGKIVFILSCNDMNCVRSVFNAYKDILFNIELKEDE